MPKIVKFSLLSSLVVGVALLQYFYPLHEKFLSLREYFQSGGVTPLIVYVLIFIVLNFFFFPTSLLLITAGSVFGVFKGYVISTIAMNISMVLIYLLGQYMLRDFVTEKISSKPKLAKIIDIIESKGTSVILLLRISPMVSFSILSYLVSLIKISVVKYLIFSTIGLLFPVLAYIYLGSISSDLISGNQDVSEAHSLLKFIGLGITILVTLIIARITKKAFKE